MATIQDVYLSLEEQAKDKPYFSELYVPRKIAENLSDGDQVFAGYEAFAFALKESNLYFENTKVCYYNHTSEEADKDGIISSITSDMVDYWEERANNAINPLLKVRYSGLVIEFKKKYTGKSANGDIRNLHVQSILDSVKHSLFPSDLTSMDMLFRGAVIATQSKHSNHIQEIKSCVDEIVKRTIDSHRGIWIRQVFILKAISGFYDVVEKRAIKMNIFDRFIRVKDDCKTSSQSHISCLFDIANVLFDLNSYKQSKENDEIAKGIELILDEYSQQMPAMNKQYWYSMLNQIYQKIQQTDDAKRLLVKIENIGREIFNDMNTISTPVKIPKDKIDTFLNEMTNGDGECRYYKIIYNFMIHKDDFKASLKKSMHDYPLAHMMRTQYFDSLGRPGVTIDGSHNEITEDQLANHIKQILAFREYFLSIVLKKNVEDGVLNTDVIMEKFSQTPFFEPEKESILREGLNAYFSGNYIVAMHVLIPQIESYCRNWVYQSEEPTIEYKKDQYQLETFDKILRKNCIESIENGDFAYYLRLVLTNQKGLNLRNDVCHGILPMSGFSAKNADLLIHIIMSLSILRPLNC